MRRSVIKIAAWGERYVKSFHENILPCLLAPNNLAALLKFGPVDLLIYSDGTLMPVYAKLPGLTVIHQIIPHLQYSDDLPGGRRTLAWTDAESLNYAKQQEADWFSFQADTLISDRFLPTVKELLSSYLAVAGAPVRTSAQWIDTNIGTERVFNANGLLVISWAAMHRVTLDYFMRNPPRLIPADPHQFYFRDGAKLVARTWQPCPFGLSYEAIAEAELSSAKTIDCYLIPSLLPERVYFHKPASDDFYLTSLDDDAGIPTFGSFEMSPLGVATAICKFARDKCDAEAYLRILEQRFEYPLMEFMSLPTDCCDEQASLALIRDLVRRKMGITA